MKIETGRPVGRLLGMRQEWDRFQVESAALTDKLGRRLRQRNKSKMTPAF